MRLARRLLAWMDRPWLRRGLISAALLGAVALWVEPQAILAEVQRFSAGWVVLALAISTLQVMLCAWRWQLTAGLIDVPLRFTYALREYYLALLVNQLLPGGVLGDAGRAHRHASQAAFRGGAWRAVIIERASGQVAVVVLTITALLLSPLWQGALGWPVLSALAAAVGAVIVTGLLLRQRVGEGMARAPLWCRALARDLKRGLYQRGVWPQQLLSSLVIVVSYGLVMVCAARAIGVELPALQLLALTPVLLLAMLIPLSVAGWGLREGTAAGVWALVGLPAAQGVAVSLAYGVIVLLASLPGIWVALSRRRPAQPSGGGSAQLHVKQCVVPAAKRSRGRAQRTFKGVDGRHFKPRSAGADQQRSDQQMQPVNGPRFDKLGHRNAATFDQYTVQSVLSQQRNHVIGAELAAAIQWQHVALYVSAGGGRCDAGPNDMQRRGGRRRQHRQIVRQAPTRVQHHPGRVSAADMTHRQLRVVSAGGADADHHSVYQGPQPVQVDQTLMAVNVMRVASFGGDSAIHTLPQLRDYPRGAASQWGQTIQQLARFRRHRLRRLPFTVGRQGNGHRAGALVALCQQPLPGICQRNIAVLIDNTRVDRGVGHDASALENPLHHAVPFSLAQARNVPHARKPGGLHVSD